MPTKYKRRCVPSIDCGAFEWQKTKMENYKIWSIQQIASLLTQAISVQLWVMRRTYSYHSLCYWMCTSAMISSDLHRFALILNDPRWSQLIFATNFIDFCNVSALNSASALCTYAADRDRGSDRCEIPTLSACSAPCCGIWLTICAFHCWRCRY